MFSRRALLIMIGMQVYALCMYTTFIHAILNQVRYVPQKLCAMYYQTLVKPFEVEPKIATAVHYDVAGYDDTVHKQKIDEIQKRLRTMLIVACVGGSVCFCGSAGGIRLLRRVATFPVLKNGLMPWLIKGGAWQLLPYSGLVYSSAALVIKCAASGWQQKKGLDMLQADMQKSLILQECMRASQQQILQKTVEIAINMQSLEQSMDKKISTNIDATKKCEDMLKQLQESIEKLKDLPLHMQQMQEHIKEMQKDLQVVLQAIKDESIGRKKDSSCLAEGLKNVATILNSAMKRLNIIDLKLVETPKKQGLFWG